MKSFFYVIWETIEVALIAVVSVLIIRTFLVQPFLVSGASMEPNFHNGDYLLIDELSYRFREPERGEVIVFHYPNDEKYYYIKRIIGLPGEELEFKNGKITVFNEDFSKGTTLTEKYLPFYEETTSANQKIKVSENEYFVLGDNRDFSFDSRSWGAVKKSEIIGAVRLRLWPFTKVMAVGKPNY